MKLSATVAPMLVLCSACYVPDVPRDRPFDGIVRFSAPAREAAIILALQGAGYLRGLETYGLHPVLVESGADGADIIVALDPADTNMPCAYHDWRDGHATINVQPRCAAPGFLVMALSHELAEALFDPGLMQAMRGGEIADPCDNVGHLAVFDALGEVVSSYVVADGSCWPN